MLLYTWWVWIHGALSPFHLPDDPVTWGEKGCHCLGTTPMVTQFYSSPSASAQVWAVVTCTSIFPKSLGGHGQHPNLPPQFRAGFTAPQPFLAALEVMDSTSTSSLNLRVIQSMPTLLLSAGAHGQHPHILPQFMEDTESPALLLNLGWYRAPQHPPFI